MDKSVQVAECRKVIDYLVGRGWTVDEVAVQAQSLADEFFEPYEPNSKFDQLVKAFYPDTYDGTCPDILRILVEVASGKTNV